MNDTVLSNEQLEVVAFTMRHGMLATVHTFDEKLIKETCVRVHFDYNAWHKEVMEIPEDDEISNL